MTEKAPERIHLLDEELPEFRDTYPVDGSTPYIRADLHEEIAALSHEWRNKANALTAERDALAAEVERLREALHVFAEVADEVDDDDYGRLGDETQAPVTAGQCRAARAALEDGKDG